MPKFWLAKSGAVLVVALAAAPAAIASNCNVAVDAVNQAGQLLRSVSQQTTLEDGRRLARRLQRAIDDAAVEAGECDCERSASKLDSATARVRRARSADSHREFLEQLNRAIDDFNVGVAHIEICIAN